jgi:hypothetical protein
MKEFIAQLALIPSKLIIIFNKLIDGITLQLSTANGAMMFLIALIIVGDIVFTGKIGVITFAFGYLKELVTIIVAGGWQLIIAIAILFLLVKAK